MLGFSCGRMMRRQRVERTAWLTRRPGWAASPRPGLLARLQIGGTDFEQTQRAIQAQQFLNLRLYWDGEAVMTVAEWAAAQFDGCG